MDKSIFIVDFSENAKCFGQKIEEYRKSLHKSQEEMAGKWKIGVSTYKSWIRKNNPVLPDTTTIIAIAKEMGCDIDYLINNLDSRTHDAKTVSEITGLSVAAASSLIDTFRKTKTISRDQAIERCLDSDVTLSDGTTIKRKDYIRIHNDFHVTEEDISEEIRFSSIFADIEREFLSVISRIVENTKLLLILRKYITLDDNIDNVDVLHNLETYELAEQYNEDGFKDYMESLMHREKTNKIPFISPEDINKFNPKRNTCPTELATFCEDHGIAPDNMKAISSLLYFHTNRNIDHVSVNNIDIDIDLLKQTILNKIKDELDAMRETMTNEIKTE